jgi:hypothetical protein
MDAAQWLRIFERNAKRQGVPEAEMVEEAISYLVGDAEQLYTDEVERERIRPDATWAQWKTAFIGKYVEVETAMELLESLLQVHQEKGESVDEYGTRGKDLVRKVGREASTGSFKAKHGNQYKPLSQRRQCNKCHMLSRLETRTKESNM